jgi:hypothetical protein
MLNVQDINNLLVIVSKATISGAEAEAIVSLQQKLVKMAEELQKEKPVTK